MLKKWEGEKVDVSREREREREREIHSGFYIKGTFLRDSYSSLSLANPQGATTSFVPLLANSTLVGSSWHTKPVLSVKYMSQTFMQHHH